MTRRDVVIEQMNGDKTIDNFLLSEIYLAAPCTFCSRKTENDDLCNNKVYEEFEYPVFPEICKKGVKEWMDTDIKDYDEIDNIKKLLEVPNDE